MLLFLIFSMNPKIANRRAKGHSLPPPLPVTHFYRSAEIKERISQRIHIHRMGHSFSSAAVPITMLILFIISTLNLAIEGMGGGDQLGTTTTTTVAADAHNPLMGHISANVSPQRPPPKQQGQTEPKSDTFLQHFHGLSRILTRKKSDDGKSKVEDELQNITKMIAADQHMHETSDQKSEIADHSTSSIHTQSIPLGKYVDFANYWHFVVKEFDKREGNSQTFALKVPPKVMAKILLRMIDAFLLFYNDKNNKSLQAIGLHPQNFVVHRERAETEPFAETELLGNVRIIYDNGFMPKMHKVFLYEDFFYKSPQQIKDNKAHKSAAAAEEADIVWTFGVIMYGLLTNSAHPFENLKGQILKDRNESLKSVRIQELALQYSIYVDRSSGEVWGFGKKMQAVITDLLEKGQQVPIPYEEVMPKDWLVVCQPHKEGKEKEKQEEGGSSIDQQYVWVNEYEPLISLTKECLQTYKNDRISMNNLRKKLNEIVKET